MMSARYPQPIRNSYIIGRELEDNTLFMFLNAVSANKTEELQNNHDMFRSLLVCWSAVNKFSLWAPRVFELHRVHITLDVPYNKKHVPFAIVL